MAHSFRSFRVLTLLTALWTLLVLTPAQAQQPTTSSAELAPRLTLHFETAPFFPDKHEVIEEDTGLVIDGCQAFFGTDNSLPETYLREAHVLLEGQSHALDTSCMYACASCSFDADDVVVMPNPGGIGYRLEGRFSDGAGTFYATWLVTPNGTARTRIVGGPTAARLSMIDGVRNDAGAAALSGGMIDEMIDELRAFNKELEAGPVAAADAAWVREMMILLDLRRRPYIER